MSMDENSSGVIDDLAADVTQTETTVTETQATETEVKEPAWLSQLPKEMRESADTKSALGKFNNLSDLANAYMQNEKDLNAAIRIPAKDDVEGIKTFFTKLGMPADPKEYELANYDMEEDDLKLSKEMFRKAAHAASLTKGQAKAMWRHEMAIAKAAENLKSENVKKYEDAFEPSYNKLMEAAYPVEAERSKAIKGEIGMIQGVFKDTPALAKAFKAAGIIYNAEAMHEFAGFIKSKTAGSLIDSKGGSEAEKSVGVMGNYSEAFLKAIGK